MKCDECKVRWMCTDKYGNGNPPCAALLKEILEEIHKYGDMGAGTIARKIEKFFKE